MEAIRVWFEDLWSNPTSRAVLIVIGPLVALLHGPTVKTPVLRGRSIDALNTAVCKRLAEQGIEIPYPKHDLYLRELFQAES